MEQPSAPLSIFSSRDGELEVTSVLDTDSNVKRLCELGICPGKIISIFRSGNPSIIKIGESRFALSEMFLASIWVRPSFK